MFVLVLTTVQLCVEGFRMPNGEFEISRRFRKRGIEQSSSLREAFLTRSPSHPDRVRCLPTTHCCVAIPDAVGSMGTQSFRVPMEVAFELEDRA